jgi:integrase
LILVALNTGMRKGELAGLKWDRIDFSLGQITVSRTRDIFGLKERKKTKLKRIIPMNQLMRMTFLKLFQGRKGSDFVFVDENDFPLEVHHIYRDFAKAQKHAGIANKIRFHDLRHTFASQFMMNNGNVFDLQKILGHTDIKMTMRYAHYSPEHLQKAMQGFELGYSNELTQNSPTAINSVSSNKGEVAI